MRVTHFIICIILNGKYGVTKLLNHLYWHYFEIDFIYLSKPNICLFHNIILFFVEARTRLERKGITAPACQTKCVSLFSCLLGMRNVSASEVLAVVVALFRCLTFCVWPGLMSFSLSFTCIM